MGQDNFMDKTWAESQREQCIQYYGRKVEWWEGGVGVGQKILKFMFKPKGSGVYIQALKKKS